MACFGKYQRLLLFLSQSQQGSMLFATANAGALQTDEFSDPATAAADLVDRSKAAHRVSTLMQEHFSMSDLTPDSPRLFASLLPPEEKKVEALR
jgi:hypothetical protein